MPSDRNVKTGNRSISPTIYGFIDKPTKSTTRQPKELAFTKNNLSDKTPCHYECKQSDKSIKDANSSVVFHYKNIEFPSISLCNTCFIKTKMHLEQAINDYGINDIDNEDNDMKEGILAEAINIADEKLQAKKNTKSEDTLSNNNADIQSN